MNRVTRMIGTILVIVVVFFSSMTLYVALAQSKYIYYPDRNVAYTPAVVGLEFEELSLKTEDGETISAWFVPCNNVERRQERALLFCHGNAGDIGDRIGSLVTFNRLGFDTLIFDYRGYGESSGKPTEQGTYNDALACWDYLVDQRGLSPGQIVVFGRSLGGAIASWMAEHSNPGALVLESVFSSVPDMAKVMFPLLPVGLFCRYRYDNEETVRNVRCPVLVAHSRMDRTCPYVQGQSVFQAANEPKLFVNMNGGHNDGGLDVSPAYQAQLLAFLAEHMRGVEQDAAPVMVSEH